MGSALDAHYESVRRFAKPGGPLSPDAPTASVKNPHWWIGVAGQLRPTTPRRHLHDVLLEEARARYPDVVQERRAILLAGPPGAGKSTRLRTMLTAEERATYLHIDADEFKIGLLREALRDGSYASWLLPAEIRQRETAGEQFFPMELAALVHEESSFLAAATRRDALRRGDNVIIDTVLSSQKSANALAAMLDDAGYSVTVIDVEVPFEVSEARIHSRWEHDYRRALQGSDPLGGRWVPSEYARSVFDGPHGRSWPDVVAQHLAETCPAVLVYTVFRTTLDGARAGAAPGATTLVRAERGAPLHPLQPSSDRP